MRRLPSALLMLALCSSAAHAQWPAGGQTYGDDAYCRVGPSLSEVPDLAGGVITYATPWSVAKRIDAGGHVLWTAAPYAPTNLPPATRLAHDGAGGAWIAWARGADVFAAHWDGSGAAAPPVTVCHNPEGLRNVLAAVADGAGGVYVIWEDLVSNTATATDLYAARVTPAGGLVGPANGALLSGGPGGEALAGAVPDGLGNTVVLVYENSAYVLRKLAANVSQPWAAPVVLPATLGGPALASDGAGQSFVAGIEGASVSNTIRLLRFDALGAPAAGWPTGGAVIASGHSGAGSARVCADALGGALVAWTDTHSEGGTPVADVRLSRVLATGATAPGWPAGGLEPGESLYPLLAAGAALAPDGVGGAYVTWADASTIDDAVHAQHVTLDGAIASGWPAAGQAISTTTWHVQAPLVVADGAGGAYAMWNEWTPWAAHESQNRTRVARLTPGGVASTPPAAHAPLALGRIAPNPAHGAFRVSFTLPDARRATLEVFDVSGRRVALRDVAGAGAHVVELGGASWAAGVHWVRLAHPAGERIERVVVMR